ncbi:MAG: hypothetical protein FWE70_08280, partial [Oscillospiraceae bacterium]|nr:hypothetical protein [Oscillospiraceae bacterium]
ALLCVLRLRGEEREGRLEAVLAGSVSRTAYMRCYLALGLAAGAAVPLLAALGFYAGSAGVMGEPLPIGFFLSNAAAYIPAIWVAVGLAAVLVGLLPRLTSACWAYLGYAVFIQFFGRVLGMPGWIEKTTPFGFVPLLIIEDVSWPALALLTLAAAALSAAGVAAFHRRDALTA